jgi:hypothetical protein
MAKPVTLPNTFGTQGGTIPLNYLDQDFTAVTNSLNDLATYSNYAVDSGSVNNFIANFSTGIVTSTLTSGLRLQFKAANANTGASTLQVQVNTVSIGTASIRLTDGSVLSANAITAGAVVDVLYDGTNFQLLNDSGGGSGTFTDLTVTGNLAVIGTSTFTGNVTANIANVTTLRVTTANISTANVTTIIATTANVTTANVTTVIATTANLTNATITTANVTTINGNVATFTGNVTIQGNGSNVQGNLTLGNVTILGTANLAGNISSGNLSVTSLTSTGNISITGSGIFKAGNVSYSDTGVVASFQSNVAGYNQIILQNTSAAANASTNFNISNNSGTATTNFGEIGINSSAFTGTGSFSTPNNVYLASASTDLVIGTYAANSVRFVVNSGATDAMQIGTTGLVGIGTTTPASKLNLAGALSFAPWTTSAPGLRIDAITFTSTSTLSGTVSANSIAQPTFAATTVAQTITNGATLYIADAPALGTNITAITNNYSLYIAGGNVFMGGSQLSIRGSGTTYPAAAFGVALSVGTVGFSVGPATYTSAAGASGTVAIHAFSTPTIATTTASQTISIAATLYIANPPQAGTNVTITNPYGIYCLADVLIAANRLRISTSSPQTFPAGDFGTTGYLFSQSSGNIITSAAGLSGTVAANSFSPGSIAATTASQTITNAVNLYVGAAPSASTNVTITNSWSLYVASGNSYFGSTLNIGGTAARATTAGTSLLNVFNGTAPVGTLTNGVSIYSVSGDLNFMDAAGNAFKVGYRNVPPVGTKTGSYTLATTDVGEYVQLGTGGAIVIPDATFAEGDIISVFNNTTGSITITCSITTAYIGGVNTDRASVTLATRGLATIFFISSTVCVINGNVS